MLLKDGASLRRRRRRVGEQHAVRLAARGVRLFITGRRGPEIADAAAAIGRGTIGVQADVSNLRDLDRLYEQISRDAGRLDVVFANAGGGDMLPLEAITAEHVDRIFGTNVKGSTAGRKGTASFINGAELFVDGGVAQI